MGEGVHSYRAVFQRTEEVRERCADSPVAAEHAVIDAAVVDVPFEESFEEEESLHLADSSQID